MNELQEIHSNLAGAVGELEKTWFDWRQQFFLGYAQAPSIRNLILVSATMQRRCQVFRTMGLPSARSSLAMWQQAALAQEGAAMGEAVQKGTNNLIQGAFKNSADAVEQVAKASQMPIINGIAATQVARNVGAEIFGTASAAKPFRRCQRRRPQPSLRRHQLAPAANFDHALVERRPAAEPEPRSVHSPSAQLVAPGG